MFYDIFVSWCESNGVSASKVLTDIGMGRSVFTNWKNGSEPSNATKKKIADYFGITVKQLLSGETEQKRPLVNNDEELTDYLEELKNRSELRMLFKLAKNATKEDVEQAVKIIEALRKE